MTPGPRPDAANKKMCQRLHVLRVMKPHLSQEELHQVYCALIRSVIDYCCPLFVKIPLNLTSKLQRVEKRAHRLIYGDERKCTCDLDGFTNRRIKLGEDLFSKIMKDENNMLHCLTPKVLPSSLRLSNFTCRTDKRKFSFFPYLTLLANNSVNI